MRLRLHPRSSPSKLEARFLWLWRLAKDPPLEREFRFYAEGRWRAETRPVIFDNARSKR